MAAVQESPLPTETSTPSVMQWPGSALPSAEALSASSVCVHAVLLMHVDDCRSMLMLVLDLVARWCMLMHFDAR